MTRIRVTPPTAPPVLGVDEVKCYDGTGNANNSPMMAARLVDLPPLWSWKLAYEIECRMKNLPSGSGGGAARPARASRIATAGRTRGCR